MNFIEAYERLSEAYSTESSEFLSFIRNVSSEQLYELIEFSPTSTVALEAHLFITPRGDIINNDDYDDLMSKYFSDSSKSCGYNHNIHTDFAKLIWCLHLKEQGMSLEDIKKTVDVDDSSFILADAVDALIAKGWIRYTYDPEDRNFAVLQCAAETKIKAVQYDAVEKILTEAEMQKLPFYVEMLDNNNNVKASKKYYLGSFIQPVFAEDVIKSITRFYTTGRLTENRKRKQSRF